MSAPASDSNQPHVYPPPDPHRPEVPPFSRCLLQPDHLAAQVRPLQGALHARVSPSASPRLSSLLPVLGSGPHRRGGFLSCTVSMALPAAAQTRSLLHPPLNPPRSRPADPPTLPLSAPTGSRSCAAGRGREGWPWVTWGGHPPRGTLGRGRRTAEPWRLLPGGSFGQVSRFAVLVFCDIGPRNSV